MNLGNNSFLTLYEQDLVQNHPLEYISKKRKRTAKHSKKIESFRAVKLMRSCSSTSQGVQNASSLDLLAQVAAQELKKENAEENLQDLNQPLEQTEAPLKKTSGKVSLRGLISLLPREESLSSASEKASEEPRPVSSLCIRLPLSPGQNSAPSPREESSECSLSSGDLLPRIEKRHAAASDEFLQEEPMTALQTSFELPNPSWNSTTHKYISEEAFLKIAQEGLLFEKQKKVARKIGTSKSSLSKLWKSCQRRSEDEDLQRPGSTIIYPWPRRSKLEIEKLPHSLCAAIWSKLYGRSAEPVKKAYVEHLKKELVKELETSGLEKLALAKREAKAASEGCTANSRPQPAGFNPSWLPSPPEGLFMKKEQKPFFQEQEIKIIQLLNGLDQPQKEIAKKLNLHSCQLSKRWSSCLEKSRYRELKLSWSDWKKEHVERLSLSVCCAIWTRCYGAKSPMTKEDADFLKKELFEESQSIFREILSGKS